MPRPLLDGPSRFLNTLHCEEIKNNVFRVTRPLYFWSQKNDKIFEIKPFICDLESCGMLRTSNEAGALHDYGYRSDCPWNLTRRQVDDLYYEALIADGNTSLALAMSKWLAVRTFGASHFHKHRIGATLQEMSA
jgi:hypothetical protein